MPAIASVRDCIALAKQQVISDIAAGHVPLEVGSFAELHDYRDANYYGGAFEIPFDESSASDDAMLNHWNQVQSAIDQWIRLGCLRIDFHNGVHHESPCSL